jgi:inosose dehydratase
MKARLGISSIAWLNDDLQEFSQDVTLSECLSQAASAGYTGIAIGERFPIGVDEGSHILSLYDISVCGGWFSGLLLDGDIEREKDRIRPQMELFRALNAPCIAYGETSRSIQGIRSAPLASKTTLTETEVKIYGRKLTEFAEWCTEFGMPIAYRHHMGAVIETEQELDLLIANSGEALGLLFDTGHITFAGGDLLRVIDNHCDRISHVYTKDVRLSVIHAIDRDRDSFLDAVVKGAFTVPGDGSLDFTAIVSRLEQYGYEGWFVVEAEQDPKVSAPFEMAIKGREELTQVLTAAGYEIET